MGRFRKLPVVIEARRVEQPYAPLVEWCGASMVKEGNRVAFLLIQTLEGPMRADLGDWIICGVAGEFYPCKPEIFEATYEEVV
jgi:hypothetical protein